MNPSFVRSLFALLLLVMLPGMACADLADALDLPSGTPVTTGNAAWTSQSSTTRDGVDAARSGTFTHSQSSTLSLPVAFSASTVLRFQWKVSSEQNCDYLRFSIDGVEQIKISGAVGWQLQTHTLAAGAHTLTWAYTKDSSVSSGSDAGWVDQVMLPTLAYHTVRFNLGAHGTRTSGGELVQQVTAGAAALSPSVTVAEGWAFTGWDAAFTAVTSDLIVTAQYAVPTLPILATPPTPREVPWQSSATLTVAATANGPLTYQWYRGDSGVTTSPVPGATGPLLVTPPLTGTTRFWVRVTNAGLSVDSPAATVTVAVPAQPLAQGAMGMGANSSGQLGDGSTTQRYTPVQVASSVAAVSAGDAHTHFVKTDGSLWAMGSNSYGQLGDGSTTNRSTPVQVATSVASVSAGTLHTLFVKTDGSLWAMGYNGDGRLGDGSGINRALPVQVATGVASVSAKSNHTLFVKTDGTLWAMGANGSGQLGDGSTTQRYTPVQISTGVASVSAGASHSLYVKTDGSLWAMGYNSSGLLGDGSDTNRPTPVQIATEVTFVSAGGNHTLFTAQTHVVTFNLGIHGTRTGGGELTQSIAGGFSATAPLITPYPGWAFVGWDQPFARVTVDLLLTAQYVVPTAPVITAAPVNVGPVALSSSIHLTVAATGNAPLAYQWYRGESGDTTSAVPGATGPLLVTPSLTATTLFWVRVTNTGLSVDSPAATITVAPALSLALGGMGDNGAGQLGDGSTTDRSTPVQGATGVTSVAAGGGHTLFIKTDGSLWAMGSNSYGQLGDGSTITRYTPVQIATGVASVSAGTFHTLFVKNDGSLWAMGKNDYGQLGDGSTITRNTPVQVASSVSSISAGASHTLFIKTDGSLWAMGANFSGQLGDGSALFFGFSRSTPVQVASGVASVSAGDAHTLFVKTDGSLWSMGSNSYGQLGDSSSLFSVFSRSTPVQVASGVASVSAGDACTLFVKTDGSLWAVGYNSVGQLGNGSTTFRSTPVQVASSVSSVSAGASHTLFIKTDGSLWAMGDNAYGQLGDGSVTNRTAPVQIATEVTFVSAGGNHTLFMAQTHVVTFNLGIHGTRTGGGELTQSIASGFSATAPLITPNPGWAFVAWNQTFARVTVDLLVTAQYVVPTAPVITATPVNVGPVARGSSIPLPVTATGNAPLAYQWYRGDSGDTTSPVPGATGPLLVTPPLVATTRFWVRVTNAGLSIDSPAATATVSPTQPMLLAAMGSNSDGQLGDDSLINQQTPSPTATDVYSVSAGYRHTLFIKIDASLWAMGDNSYGQLGDGSYTSRSTPVQVATGVASVSAGADHTLFVKADGSLWAMGEGYSGQLGDGFAANRALPVQVATGVASISAGAYHTLFIKTDGSLWAVGRGYSGQLGNGSATDRTLPVQVATNVVSASAGGSHTLFVKSNGSLWAMGYNSYGQLGDGSTTDRSTPVQVATGVASVSAGGAHTLFVKTDGSLWAMGYNYSGQLGDGSTSSRALPVQVAIGIASVFAGNAHSLFAKTDGSLWAMGYNASGQLGDGSTTDRHTPVQISASAVSVSAGGNHTLLLRTLHTVTFDLGAHGTRTGGGPLVQPVIHGTAAIAPSVTGTNGRVFIGWDVPFSSVNADLTVTAQYGLATLPVLSSPPTPRDTPWRGSTTLTATATANGPLTYQWFRGESGDTSFPVPGATGPLLVTPALTTTTRFWVQVANSGLSVDSPAATVTVAPVQSLVLAATGSNEYGQLGDGSTNYPASPVQVATGVTSVSAGGDHTLFVKIDGSLWATGRNTHGQLGDLYATYRDTPVQVDTEVASVAAGGAHTLFVKTDGSLWAMGNNEFGQLGDGSTASPDTPVQVATGVASVSAGWTHSLFVKTDGSLWAMGANYYGQLGDGSTTSRPTPVQVATGVASVSAGEQNTMFVKTDGSLWAMGYNAFGTSSNNEPSPVHIATGIASVSAGRDLSYFVKSDGSLWAIGNIGSDNLGDGSSPIQVATGVASVSTGIFHTLFVKTDGSLWAMGDNYYGQLGDGSQNNSSTPIRVVATGVAFVSAGQYHTLFGLISHTVTFALGAYGTRTGGGSLVQTVVRGTPATAPTLSVTTGWFLTGWDVSFATVSSDLTITAQYAAATVPILSTPPAPRAVAWGGSAALTVAATANGPLAYQWYRGESGDTTAPVSGATGPLLVTPPLTANARFWVRVTNVTLSVDSPATNVTVPPQIWPLSMSAMGDSYYYYGQLGDGYVANRPSPVQATVGVASVSNGSGHTLFVKTDGSLWALGNNYYGQLGGSSLAESSTPIQIALSISSSAVGELHSVFVKSDGSLWAVGNNDYGQLGDGSTTSRSTPVQVATGVASVSADAYQTFFVKTDGSLWAMGHNYYGQLGTGSTANAQTPMQIASGVASVTAGWSHSLFVKTDGSLWAMGANYSGPLGDGSTTNRTTPVQVATGVASVSAGSSHTLFVKTDSSLWAMGRNYSGQLGDGSSGSLSSRYTPVQVATSVTSVSAGNQHSLFVKTDGSLWAMGDNSFGQLGDGSFIDRSTPVQIATGVTAVDAGGQHTLFLGTAHTVTFALDTHATRSGGGALVQTVMSGTPAAPPTLTVAPGWVFTGWDVAFTNVTTDLVVTAMYQSSFAAWATAVGLSGPAATPTADPDTDGTPNLLEYLFGTSPTLANSAALTRPSITVGTVSGQPALVLTHRRRKAALASTVYQQTTTLADPAAWTPITVTPIVVNPDADGDGLVELISVSVPLPAGANPRLFLRLSVSE